MPSSPTEFNQRVYDIVRIIPAGHVMTYGDIAALIPAPETIDDLAYRRVRARWVGYALARCQDDLPWQRVVNARGEISSRPGHGPKLQRTLLEMEGVVFDSQGRIDLTRLRWMPDEVWLTERGYYPPMVRTKKSPPDQAMLF
jgi:methylated-DNA-protein-cysteine methyltransferase-like protein